MESLCCKEFCWKSAMNLEAGEWTSKLGVKVLGDSVNCEFVYVSSRTNPSPLLNVIPGKLGELDFDIIRFNRDSGWKPKAACQSSLECTVGKESGIEAKLVLVQSTFVLAVRKKNTYIWATLLMVFFCWSLAYDISNLPVWEFWCNGLVEIFWKVSELKKLLLSGWKMDRWFSCTWVPLYKLDGGCWLLPWDEFVLAGDVPEHYMHTSLHYKDFIINNVDISSMPE